MKNLIDNTELLRSLSVNSLVNPRNREMYVGSMSLTQLSNLLKDKADNFIQHFWHTFELAQAMLANKAYITYHNIPTELQEALKYCNANQYHIVENPDCDLPNTTYVLSDCTVRFYYNTDKVYFAFEVSTLDKYW